MDKNHWCLYYKQLRTIKKYAELYTREGKTKKTDEDAIFHKVSEKKKNLKNSESLILRGHAITGLLHLNQIYPIVANNQLLKICHLLLLLLLLIS